MRLSVYKNVHAHMSMCVLDGVTDSDTIRTCTHAHPHTHTLREMLFLRAQALQRMHSVLMYAECHGCTEKFTPLNGPDLMVFTAILAGSQGPNAVVRTNVTAVSIAVVNLASRSGNIHIATPLASLGVELV